MLLKAISLSDHSPWPRSIVIPWQSLCMTRKSAFFLPSRRGKVKARSICTYWNFCLLWYDKRSTSFTTGSNDWEGNRLFTRSDLTADAFGSAMPAESYGLEKSVDMDLTNTFGVLAWVPATLPHTWDNFNQTTTHQNVVYYFVCGLRQSMEGKENQNLRTRTLQ